MELSVKFEPARIALFAFASLILTACLSLEQNPKKCTYTAFQPRHLDPDSLVLFPTSYLGYFIKQDGNAYDDLKEIGIRASIRDSGSALSSLDSNGMTLYIAQQKAEIPPPTWEGNGEYQCPSAREPAYIPIGGTSLDTSLAIEIRKGGVPVRAWTLEYKFDTTLVPSIGFAEIPGGLQVTLHLKPGTGARDASINASQGDESFDSKWSGDSMVTQIFFKQARFLNESIDSATLNAIDPRFCVYSDPGPETMTVDGETTKTLSTTCWELYGPSFTALYNYWKKSCRDCR